MSGIRYFITKDAARRIYDACKNVRDSISGGIGKFIIKTLIGDWNFESRAGRGSFKTYK